MKLKEAIKPISYIKTHASEVIRDVSENHKTMIVTQNGEAKVILQDIETFEKTQETMALLKILAQSQQSKAEGKGKTVKQTFKDLRKRIQDQDNV